MKATKLFKAAEWISLCSVIFWMIETALFLIIEGWHLKATHPIEIICDGIVKVGFWAVCTCIVWCMVIVLKQAAEFVDYVKDFNPDDYIEKNKSES